MWLPSLVCVLLLGWVTSSEIQVDEIVSVTDVSAVLGGAIHLPCILQNPVDDQVALVIWFKDGATSPIYSLDARSVPQQQQATHWADERSLGGRAFFRDAGNDSHLALEHVREADAGSYRCRVDFRRSPTRNSIINVAVIVPPTNVTILNSNGTFLRDYIGPYLEGATPELKCLSVGGRPKPILSWWLDDSPINPLDGTVSDSLAEEEEKRVSSMLKLLPLTRRSLLSKVSCRASNNEQPISTSVSIDMLLPPVSVRLLGDNLPLSAGRQYEVACQTAGSRPAANITWWRDGVMVDGARETTSADGNVTTSVLTLLPMPDDSGRQLCCRAANLHLPPLDNNVALHDCWSLLVRYSPIVSLELGSNLNGSAIREGVDVYFECIIRANPWIHKLVWRHNGRQLHSNTSAGTLLSNQTLVLQAVRRSRTGLYTCLASNEEGDSESNPFNLDVKYAPECVPGQQRVWGAARREELSVPCLVDARPPATLFRWTFNSSNGGAGAVGAPSAVKTQPGRSVATHIPVSEKDYGTLMCWAKNDLGEQLHPCVFLVVPAGRPDAPHDCHVVSRTATSLHVSCTRGSDGGLPPQQFTLELLSGRRLVANVTSRTAPEFTVAGLEPGTPYVLHVFSSNGKGRSINSAPLNVSTLKATQQHRRVEIVATDPPATPTLVPPPLWLLVAALTCVLLLALAAVLVAIRLRGWRFRRGRAGGSSASNSPRDKTPPLLLGPPDDNPDVVPHKDEIDIPNPTLKALQQYNIVVEARPINVDSAAQTVLYSTVNSFPMTEAVVLTPMWPADSAPAAAAVVMESLASAPRLQDAGTQTPAGDQQHKESTV